MRQKKLLLVLFFALASGGLAAFLALGYLRTSATPLMAAQAAEGKVAVAARDLALGSVLRNEDVRLVDWPTTALPAGYASSAAQLVGRGVITSVAANEPLLSSKLADKEAGGGLPIVIPEGMRAVSVKVDEVIAVAGFVTAGTRVDVVVSMPGRGDNEQPTSRVILQNVQALAAGQTIQRDAEGKPQTVTVITLLVSPEDAETLTLAATEGKIQLALRNTLDMGSVETRGARVSNLTRSAAPAAARPGAATREVRVRATTTAPAAREGTVVETIRGGQRTLSTFAPGN